MNSIDSEPMKKSVEVSQNKKPFVVWFTGLSGSGKTTVSGTLKVKLSEKGILSVIFDGDTMRKGISTDLGFSDDDRKENIRRTAEMAKLVALSGVNAICALISPFLVDRQQAREILSEFHFVEVFVDTPLEVCEQRDPKGFYKRARIREILDFTGIDSIYENPLNPEVRITTDAVTTEECVQAIFDYLKNKEIL
jgi:adenylyl-sulfate kinase